MFRANIQYVSGVDKINTQLNMIVATFKKCFAGNKS